MTLGKDKLKHMGACGVTAAGVSLAEGLTTGNPLGAWLAGFMAGTAIGIGKEYGDKCAPGNRWDWADILWDELGAIAGATIGSIWLIFK